MKKFAIGIVKRLYNNQMKYAVRILEMCTKYKEEMKQLRKGEMTRKK